MINEILPRALILAGILLIGIPLLYTGVTYLWNRKYVPARLIKGQQLKPFGRLKSEWMKYTFSEDTATLAKKASPKVQKLLSVKSIYFFMMIVGSLGFILTGNFLFLLTFPLFFFIALGRSVKPLQARDKFLKRVFAIASASIRFGAGIRGKNAPPPAYWENITVKEWKADDDPLEMIITFPPGQGPDLNAQTAFDKTFKQNITDDHDWSFEWDLTHDQVTIKWVPNLKTLLEYPGSADAKWSVFPMGETKAGVASYDVGVFPHVLIGGPSGTGKSVLQRNIVFHVIQHNDRWRFLGVDLKRVELTPYNKYKKTVKGIATDVEQGLEVLKYAYNDMMDRYKMMEERNVNNLMDLDDPPYCLLIMVDEATMFLGASGSKTDEGKAEDAMKGEAADLVGKILRLGRAAGVHMVIAMQRPDATVLRGEFKANMDVRLAAGRMDSTPSSMILDSGEAVNLPGIRGRGVLRVGGSLDIFQGYFAKQDWIDSYILEHPETEPSCVAPGGHLYEEYQQLQLKKKSLPEPDVQEENFAEEPQPAKKKSRFRKEASVQKFVEPEKQIPEAIIEPVVEPDLDDLNIDDFIPAAFAGEPEEEDITENQQNLMDVLNRKPSAEAIVDVERVVPAFFTESSPSKPKPVIEPDLDLNDDDFILDDFDDDFDDDSSSDVILTPPAPGPVETPGKLAWEPISPFDDEDDDDEEEEQVAVAVPVSAPVRPVAPVARPLPARPMPTKPSAPVSSPFQPKKLSTEMPKKPVSPFRNNN
jgi:hypothetical protein